MPKMLSLQGTGKTKIMGTRLIDLLIFLGDPELEERWGGVGWDTHPVFVIRGGDGQENEGLNTTDPIPSTATGFFLSTYRSSLFYGCTYIQNSTSI